MSVIMKILDFIWIFMKKWYLVVIVFVTMLPTFFVYVYEICTDNFLEKEYGIVIDNKSRNQDYTLDKENEILTLNSDNLVVKGNVKKDIYIQLVNDEVANLSISNLKSKNAYISLESPDDLNLNVYGENYVDYIHSLTGSVFIKGSSNAILNIKDSINASDEIKIIDTNIFTSYISTLGDITFKGDAKVKIFSDNNEGAPLMYTSNRIIFDLDSEGNVIMENNEICFIADKGLEFINDNDIIYPEDTFIAQKKVKYNDDVEDYYEIHNYVVDKNLNKVNKVIIAPKIQ